MEFSSRGFQRNSAQPANASTNVAGSSDSDKPTAKKTLQKIKLGRPFAVLFICLLISVVVLIVALILGLSTKSIKPEGSYVDTNNYQVVALVDKQAYFGKIGTINSHYIVLYDVYYIQDNGSAQDVNSTNATNSTLVKRGCEIHKPQDKMIISRDQVNFWENLQSDGQVAKAIKQWQSENKNGQKCDSQSSTTQNQSSNSATDSSTNTDESSATDTSSDSASSNDSSATDTSANSSTSNNNSNTPTSPGTSTPSTPSN